jgi:hypothetical protein
MQGGIGLYSVDGFDFHTREDLLLTLAAAAEISQGSQGLWPDADGAEHGGDTRGQRSVLKPRLLALPEPNYAKIQLCWDVGAKGPVRGNGHPP